MGLQGHQCPRPQDILRRTRAPRSGGPPSASGACNDCAASVTSERTDQGDGRHSFTHPATRSCSASSGRQASALPRPRSRSSCVLRLRWDGRCGDADEHLALLRELREADPSLWEGTVRDLLEGRRIATWRVADYLRATDEDSYVGRCSERLRNRRLRSIRPRLASAVPVSLQTTGLPQSPK